MTQAEKIKKLLEESILFTPSQKQAWLKMLPQMTESEILELKGILVEELEELKKDGYSLIEDPKLEAELLSSAVESHGASLESLKAIATNQASPVSNSSFGKELKREIETLELRKPTPEEMGSLHKPQVPKPMAVTKTVPPKPSTPVAPIRPLAPAPPMAQRPMVPAHGLNVPHAPKSREEILPAGALKSLIDIRTVDDLKRIRTLNLRQGELAGQIDLIRAKIVSIAQAKKLLPFYTVSAFEASPLYKDYMQIGSAILDDPDADRAKAFEKATQKIGGEKLTLREFESIADLKKQIEQL